MKNTAVKWFSNQSYELFEQYSEGKFDRPTLNKLMVEAEKKALEMEKDQLLKFGIECQLDYIRSNSIKTVEDIWEKTYGGNK